MTDSRVLVVGATGQLGAVITRKLLDSGAKVRALARNASALAAFAPRAEIAAVADGRLDRRDNSLKNAPHTADEVGADEWTHAYPREQAAFPLPWVRSGKYWPPVKRVDNAYGDRNLMCTCAPLEEYARAAE